MSTVPVGAAAPARMWAEAAATHGPAPEVDSEGAHYVLGSYLTEGGMAAVYLGKRKAKGGFEKEVVLKRLRPELLHRPQLLELLLREARLAAGLEHPGIVRTLDLASLGGHFYLVMEYVRGGDLRLLLKRARRLGRHFSVPAALLIGRELLTALDYAHRYRLPDREQAGTGVSVGIIHRDISPANILVSIAGEVKLTDFGIAVPGTEALAGDAPSHSRPPEPSGPHPSERASERPSGPVRSDRRRDELGLFARGKVGYMAPEQARGEAVDARSDLFSLAAVLYEVLTLNRLFVGQEGQSPAQIYAQAITPPSRLSALPPEGDAVFLKALASDPAARYQSASAFYDALLGLTRRHGLWLDRAELAQHLRDVCGDDPGAWSMIEERSSTAVITSIPSTDDDGEDGEEPEVGDRTTLPWDQSLDQGWLACVPPEPLAVLELDRLDGMDGTTDPAAEAVPRSRPPRPQADVAEHDQPITAPWPTLPHGAMLPHGSVPLHGSVLPRRRPSLPSLGEDTQPLPPSSLPEASEVAAVAIELTVPLTKEPADGPEPVAGPDQDQATTARHRAMQAPVTRPRYPALRSPAHLLGLILLAMLIGALLAGLQRLLSAP